MYDSVPGLESQALLTRFTSWIEVPDDLKTKSSWLQLGRKLNANPVALLKNDESLFAPDIRLYSFEQTRPRTAREKSLDVIWDVFIKGHNGNFIAWNEDKRHWQEIGLMYCPRGLEQHLRKSDLLAHLSHRSIFGVIGHGERTHFLMIDLDIHHKENDPITPERRAKFLQALRILLDNFHGWHLQVKQHDAEGVHLILVLDHPVMLQAAVADLRRELRNLDSMHPGLGLASLEVYPDPSQGVRLPLGRDRVVLTDKPLVPVNKRGGGLRGDWLEYSAWLADAERQYMTADDMYHFVEERLRKPEGEKAPVVKSTPTSSGDGEHVSFRGQTRQKIVAFWTGADKSKGQLNRMIAVTARCLRLEVGEDEAVDLLEKYVDDLPDFGVSSRLRSAHDEVSADIRRTVAKVYRGNSGQRDAKTSDQKMEKVREAWAKINFLVSDKSTWSSSSLRSDVAGVGATPAFGWTEAEKGVIERNIMPILKARFRKKPDAVAELQTACDVVKDIVETVNRYSGGEVAMTLIDTILKKHGIAPGRSNAKRTRLMEVLDQLGWVVVRAKAWAKHRATSYMLGESLNNKFRCQSASPPDLYIARPSTDEIEDKVNSDSDLRPKIDESSLSYMHEGNDAAVSEDTIPVREQRIRPLVHGLGVPERRSAVGDQAAEWLLESTA